MTFQSRAVFCITSLTNKNRIQINRWTFE